MVPLELIKMGRYRKSHGKYLFYLVKHGTDKWPASLAIIAGLGVFIVLYIFIAVPVSGEKSVAGTLGIWGSVVSCNLIAIAYGRFRRGMEILASSVQEQEITRVEGTEAFVLYLRSFRDDLFQFDLRPVGIMRLLFLPPSGAVLEQSFRTMRSRSW